MARTAEDHVYTYRTLPMGVQAFMMVPFLFLVPIVLMSTGEGSRTFLLFPMIILLPYALFSIVRLMSFVVERIEIKGGKLRWVDWLGRERVSTWVSDIGDSALTDKRSLAPGATGGPLFFRTFSLETPDGLVKFSGMLKDVEKLVKVFRPEGIFVAEVVPKIDVSGVELRCSYRSAPALVVAIFLTVWGSLFAGGPVGAWVTGNMKPGDSPAQLIPFIVLGLGGLVAAGYFYGTFLNSRIDIANGEIVVTDWRKRTTTHRVEDLQVGTYRRRNTSKGGSTCEVSTPTGKIKWSNSIRSFDELCDFMKAATNPPAS